MGAINLNLTLESTPEGVAQHINSKAALYIKNNKRVNLIGMVVVSMV